MASDEPRRVASTKRRGRMTDAKRAVLAGLGSRLGLTLDDRPLGAQLTGAFGREAPRLVDVGIGSGGATVAWALAHPDHDVVAFEVHPPSLVAALIAVDESGLTNVRVAEADVRTLLDRAAPGDVGHLRLLFPDPWPKRRHHHRRLVDAAFLARLGQVVPADGTFHLATDWDGYAAEVGALLGDDPGWLLVDGAAPTRPVTPYERIGLDAGRAVTDLVARRA